MPGAPLGNYDYTRLWTFNQFVGERPYDPGNVPTVTAAPPPPTPTPPIAIGLEPQAYEAVLYGKVMPVFIGGKLLIGGRIIEGPYFSDGAGGDKLVDYVAYHAICADPTEARTFKSFRLRAQEAWTLSGGYLDTTKLPSGGLDSRTGTRTQSAFTQSIERNGSGAIAYRDGLITSIRGASLRAFGGIIPFPSGEWQDDAYADGIPRGIAIEKCLRYMRLSDADFEVSVTGEDTAWIIGAQLTLQDFLQRLRGIFPHYNITYTDKVRIIEPTGFFADHNLTSRNLALGQTKFIKGDPLQIARLQRYGFINSERDNEPDVVVAQEDAYPQPSTSSVSDETIELPIVTNAAQATADNWTSFYEKMAARNRMEGVGLTSLFGMEVGDGLRFQGDSTINSFMDKAVRAAETQHVYEKWQVQFRGDEVLNCGVLFSVAAVFIGANSQFGEDVDDLGFGYAPAVAETFGDGLPTRSRTNSARGMAIAEVPVSGNGEAIFVNDSAAHLADFRHVFTDDDYIYYVDVDAGLASVAALIVRISRTDFTSRTVLDWGTWYAMGGYAYNATLHQGKIYLAVYRGGGEDSNIVIVDLSDFTTSGLSSQSAGVAIRCLGMAGLGGYVYMAMFNTNTDENYIYRLDISTDTWDSIPGTNGGEGRLCGGVADPVTGKVFFGPSGRDSFFSFPTINDRMVGVVDTNVTFDSGAIDYFSVLQDTNVDYAYANSGNLHSYTPWIVGDTVRLLTETTGNEVRISSFSTDDYTVADAGKDLSDYVVAPGVGTGLVATTVRTYGDYAYILLSNNVAPFVGLMRVSHGYNIVEVVDELE